MEIPTKVVHRHTLSGKKQKFFKKSEDFLTEEEYIKRRNKLYKEGLFLQKLSNLVVRIQDFKGCVAEVPERKIDLSEVKPVEPSPAKNKPKR